jgi:RNA polymerase sigma-70 factor (ECF subfamily)
MSNGELVRQTLAGRTEAFEELVRHWAARITALCHAKVGRADVADDLAQETLLRGFRALSSLAEPEKFGAWLCGIALRTCLDWLKAKERSQVPFSALAPDWDPEDSSDPATSPQEAAVDQEDEHRYLLAEVEALPEAYRKVVMLYYYDDLTYRELAQILGVSPATINARLTKARALLRERLSATGQNSQGPQSRDRKGAVARHFQPLPHGRGSDLSARS